MIFFSVVADTKIGNKWQNGCETQISFIWEQRSTKLAKVEEKYKAVALLEKVSESNTVGR